VAADKHFMEDTLPCTLLDALDTEGLILLDERGSILTWNAGAAQLDGVSARQALGQNFASRFLASAGGEASFAGWLEEARRSGRAQGEAWRQRDGGSAYWASLRFTRVPEGVALAFRDETNCHERLSELWNENELLRSLQRSAPLDFWAVGAGGDRRLPVPRRLLPRAQSVDWYRDGHLIDAEDRAAVMAARQNAFADRCAYRVEYRTNEPEPRLLVEAGVPRTGQHGQWLGLAGYLQVLPAPAAARTAACTADIRQSLGSILQSVQMAQESADPAETHMWINAVDLAARLLLSQLDEAVELAPAAPRSRPRVRLVRFDPRALLREVFESAAARAAERGVSFTAELYWDLPARVQGDATGVRQALKALLGFAVQHAQSEARLTLHGPRAGQLDAYPVRFDVTCDGAPLEPALSEWLAEPAFLEREPAVRHGEAGVQLSYARRVVESMRGTFAVTAAPPTFVCELEWFAAEALAAVARDGIDLRGKFVLSVTPDRALRKVLEMRCAALGVGVMTVDSVAEAAAVLDLADPAAFSLVLAQLKLPTGTGHELARRLAADPKWRGLPRLTLSLAGEPGQAQAAHEAGFHAYLTPPFPVELMRDAMETALARAAAGGGMGELITRFSLAEDRAAA